MPQSNSASAVKATPATTPAAGQRTAAAGSVEAAGDLRLAALRTWLHDLAATSGIPPASPDDGLPLDALLPLNLASLVPASADAGFRRYFRLHAANGTTVIAMDAPPPEKSREFVAIQQLMRDAGVHVPTIHAADIERGFMLLSDLGSTAYIDVLDGTNEDRAKPLMRDALRTLLRWQKSTQPDVLPPYDETLLRRELDLFPEWYVERHLGMSFSDDDRKAYEGICRLLIDNALRQPQVFVHRDFMVRNLMLGEPNPAVIDFQDSVHGPIGYDVAALMRDAFLSWDEAFEIDCIAWYWGEAKAAGLPVHTDFSEFYREVEWTGLQRHLKILGLFARLQYRDGKPRYLADTPRFVAYVRRVAHRYRELRPLARLFDKLENRPQQVGYTF